MTRTSGSRAIQPIHSATETSAPTSIVQSAPAALWTTVLDDRFDSGGLPSYWKYHDFRYSSSNNCASPSHVTVSGGYLRLLMRYETTGKCGAGWYTAGMMVSSAYGSIDQRVTVRFRIVPKGVSSHRIIPMRWPTADPWPMAGEEDYCEGDLLTRCTTFLHYGASNSLPEFFHRGLCSDEYRRRVSEATRAGRDPLREWAKPTPAELVRLL